MGRKSSAAEGENFWITHRKLRSAGPVKEFRACGTYSLPEGSSTSSAAPLSQCLYR